MGEIYFQFEGICTNFRIFEHPLLPALHRVVLPNVAAFSSAFGHDVEPHEARMYLGEDDDVGMPLDGVVITVDNAIGTGCTYDPSYGAVPRLGALMHDAHRELSEPSLPALLGMNHELAAAYIDFTSATFSACSSPPVASPMPPRTAPIEPPPPVPGAAITRARIETDGTPFLIVRKFPRSLMGDAEVWSRMIVPPIKTIYISNESSKQGGSHDFQLSYLLANKPPQDPPLPSSVTASSCAFVMKTRLQPDISFDIFCSNSNYP
jgi:hypothetical protein